MAAGNALAEHFQEFRRPPHPGHPRGTTVQFDYPAGMAEADIAFAGTVDGLWEDKDSVINTDWKGGEYGCNGGLMKECPREGHLTIRMRSNKNPSQPDYDDPR